jgi:hypothetical protein
MLQASLHWYVCDALSTLLLVQTLAMHITLYLFTAPLFLELAVFTVHASLETAALLVDHQYSIRTAVHEIRLQQLHLT